jgi:hypothetical protein
MPSSVPMKPLLTYAEISGRTRVELEHVQRDEHEVGLRLIRTFEVPALVRLRD